MSDSANVKKIMCSGPLTYRAVGLSVQTDYIQTAINNKMFSGRKNQMDAATEASNSVSKLLEQFERDIKAIQNKLNKTGNSTKQFAKPTKTKPNSKGTAEAPAKKATSSKPVPKKTAPAKSAAKKPATKKAPKKEASSNSKAA